MKLDGSRDDAGPADPVERRASGVTGASVQTTVGEGQALGQSNASVRDRRHSPTDQSRSDTAPKARGPKPQRRDGRGGPSPDTSTTAQPKTRDASGANPGADTHAGKRRRPAHGRRTSAALRGGERTYAALDLGTNNFRLLVARPSRRSFLVVDAFSKIIRLGEGVSASGRLSDAAMDRTIGALKVCADKMIRKDVQRSRLIATEACRMAENGEEFVARVRDEVGISLEIVSRETEAKLAVSGCASLIDQRCDWALVFDIGGGSSELIWLDLRRRRRRNRRTVHDRVDAQDCIDCWTSLPVGVVTLAERFGGQFVTAEIYEEMVQYVSSLLAGFEAEHGVAERTRGADRHFLGTSGTVTTVAGIHLKLPRYDRRRVDGCWLASNDVRTVTERLAQLDYDGRVAEPCIGKDRADLVLAGCAILEAMMRLWPCERLRVADRGLREGILATLMAEDGVYRSQRRNRRG